MRKDLGTSPILFPKEKAEGHLHPIDIEEKEEGEGEGEGEEEEEGGEGGGWIIATEEPHNHWAHQ